MVLPCSEQHVDHIHHLLKWDQVWTKLWESFSYTTPSLVFSTIKYSIAPGSHWAAPPEKDLQKGAKWTQRKSPAHFFSNIVVAIPLNLQETKICPICPRFLRQEFFAPWNHIKWGGCWSPRAKSQRWAGQRQDTEISAALPTSSHRHKNNTVTVPELSLSLSPYHTTADLNSVSHQPCQALLPWCVGLGKSCTSLSFQHVHLCSLPSSFVKFMQRNPWELPAHSVGCICILDVILRWDFMGCSVIIPALFESLESERNTEINRHGEG